MKPGDWGVSPRKAIPGLARTEDSLHHAHYGVFFFKKRAYFDLWWSNHPDYQGKSDVEAGRLHVYKAEQNQTDEVCTYRFDRTID